MPEESFVPDVFFDTYSLNVGALGASITILSSIPSHAPNTPAQMREIERLRLSQTTAKLLAYQLVRTIMQYEVGEQIDTPVSGKALNGCGIAKEDWDAFWQRARDAQRMP